LSLQTYLLVAMMVLVAASLLLLLARAISHFDARRRRRGEARARTATTSSFASQAAPVAASRAPVPSSASSRGGPPTVAAPVASVEPVTPVATTSVTPAATSPVASAASAPADVAAAEPSAITELVAASTMRAHHRTLFQRMTGRNQRPTIEEEVGYVDQDRLEERIGVRRPSAPASGPVATAPARIVVAGTVTPSKTLVAAAREPDRRSDRRRLWRDTAAALVGVAAVLFIAINVVPRDQGEVLAETATPDVSAVVIEASPSPSASLDVISNPPAAATEDPNATPMDVVPPAVELAPTVTPKPTAKPTPRATPRPTARPVITVTPAPTQKPTAKPTPKPTPKPKPTPTPLPTPVAFLSCSVNGLTVTCDGTGSSDATTYSWDYADGTTDVGKNPGPHTYAQAGGYTITLTVANASGVDSATQYVSVGP